MEILIAIVVIAVLIIGWLVLTYNGMVGLRNQVKNAWTQIDVQLKRRHDLIPNLVETVRGVMKFEQETLERVMRARAAAVSVTTPAAAGRAEGELTQALGRLFALFENYPDLKSNQNAMQLQEELTSTENRIAFARQFYNDLVAKFNTALEIFPNVLIAGSYGFQTAEYFEITEGQERETPRVDLSLH